MLRQLAPSISKSRDAMLVGLMEGSMVKTNVCGVDRVLRVALGLVLLAMAFVGPQTPWGFIGLVPLLTGLFSTCPLYSLIGLSTCAVKANGA